MSRFREILDIANSLHGELGDGKLIFAFDGALQMIWARPGSGLPPFQATFEEADFEPGREVEIMSEFVRRARLHFGLDRTLS